MNITLPAIIIEIDNALLSTELGGVPLKQTSGSGTKSVEVWIPNDTVQNFRNVLSTEARRLNVPTPHPQDILVGIDLQDDHTLAVTEYSFKLQELPRLLLLLESGLEHREQYPFMINDEDPYAYAPQTAMAF